MEGKKMSEVKVIHPISGSAPIIAKVSKLHRDEYYTLENPFSLMYYRDEDNNERVTIGNILVYAKGNKVDIRADHILFIYEPSDETLEFYNKKVIDVG
jgi:hypothetical protein